MADPLSVTTSILAISTVAIQSAKSLFETVKQYQGRDRTLRRLLDELDDLTKVLESLTKATKAEESVLLLLLIPVRRCSLVCQEFESSMEIFGRKSKTTLRDWTRMRFMRGDINEFIETIAGYKSTILVGLGTITMHTSNVSHDVLTEYSEMIQNTTYALQLHLQRIDEKMKKLSTEGDPALEGAVDLNDEKEVTRQNLLICEEVKSYIQNLSSRASYLLQKSTETAPHKQRYEAQMRMHRILEETQDTFTKEAQRLSRHLQSLDHDNTPDNERKRFVGNLEEEILNQQRIVDASDNKMDHDTVKHNEESQDDSNVDSDDASSHASSVYSNKSLASSATSAGGIPFITNVRLQRFVNTLFCTEELLPISRAALQDETIGQNRFERNVQRLIIGFGQDLRLESTTQDQLGAAKLLRTRQFSARVVRQIVESNTTTDEDGIEIASKPVARNNAILAATLTPNDPDHHSSNPVSAEDEKSEILDDLSDDEQEAYDNMPDFEAIERFLLNCEAYSTLRIKLLDFVHGSYQGRVTKALGSEVILDNGEALSGPGLRAIGRELSWAPAHVITFHHCDTLSISDRLKAFVENSMGEKWNWWPLAARKHQLREYFVRVGWTTPCEERRCIDVPEKAAQSLRAAISQAPIFINHALSINICPSGSNQSPIAQFGDPFGGNLHAPFLRSGASTPPPRSLASQLPAHALPGSQPHMSGLTNAVPFNSPTSFGQSLAPRHIYLCVRTGLLRDHYRYADCRTDTLFNDDELYEWLKKQYRDLRGPLRQWLSPWRYDRCEFYQFHKRRGASPSKEGFPPDDEPNYEFVPCPLVDDHRPPNGPIMAMDFRHNYYNCPHHCHSWHRHRYRKLRYSQRDDIRSLPQRKSCIDIEDGQRGVFWGIYAKEERNFVWILAYGIIINIPGTVFFFLWLFSWGHVSDLQNAAIPLTFSTALTILFVGLLYESREVKR